MRIVLLIVSLLMLWASCQEQDSQVLAQVGEDKLYLSDVLVRMPLNTTEDDSILFVRKKVDQWVNEQLLYQQGMRNVQDLEALERQAAQYRRDLIARTYQAERLAIYANEVSEEECTAFYEQNKAQILLKESMIQGIFVQLPAKSTKIKQLKDWLSQMLNGNMDHAEELEQYCLQRASYYDPFLDQWSELHRVTDRMTEKAIKKLGDTSRYLRRQVYQLADEEYVYLLMINDFRIKGDSKPYEVCSNEIHECLVEQKQNNFRKQLQLELRDEALRTGLLKLK